MTSSSSSFVLPLLLVLCLQRTCDAQSSPCVTLNNTFWPAQGGAVTKYVKLGTISGKWSKYGDNMCNAATLWLQKLQATSDGGLKIGPDATVTNSAANVIGFEVYVEDATSSLGGETLATDALVARGVHVIIAPYSSTLTPGTALRAATNGGVPVISWGAASESVFICPSGVTDFSNYQPCTAGGGGRARFDNLFSVITPGPKYFTLITEIANTYNVRQIGTVYEDTAATRSYAMGAMARGKELGMNNSVEIEVVVDPATTTPVITNTATLGMADIQKTVTAKDDSTAMREVARLLRDLHENIGIHPEMVVGGTYYRPCIELVKELVACRWFPKVLAVASCTGDPKMFDTLKEDARWVVGPTQWDRRLAGSDFDETSLRFPLFKSVSNVPAPKIFNDMWKAQFGSDPNYQAAGSMAAMVMLGAALSDVLPTTVLDAAEIKTQLGKVYATSFFGRLTTNKWGMNDRRSMSVYQYDERADLQLVAPLSAATARVIYPVPDLLSDDRNAPCGPGKKVIGANRMCDSDERAARAAANNVSSGVDKTTASWELLGAAWCDTHCESCPPGTFSDDKTGSTTCTSCPNNTVAGMAGTTKCKVCPEGMTHNDNRTECIPCPAGTARGADDVRCEPCGPGTFTSVPGLSICLKCDFDKGGWADGYNNTGCIACPENSKRPLGSKGVAVTECLCQPGYFQLDMKPNGAACVRCPNEATCDGTKEIKISSSSLSSSSSAAAVSSTGGGAGDANNATAAEDGGSKTIVNALPYPKPEYFGFKEDIMLVNGSSKTPGYLPKFWPCPAGRCAGGPDFLCNPAWRGAMCSRCADGYFSVGVSCFKCTDDGGIRDAVIFTVCAGCIIFLWVGMNTVVAGGYDTFDITLIFLQVLSTVQSFQLKWPGSLNQLAQASSLVNFDLDFIAPDCFTDWRYVHRATLTLVLPLLLIFVAYAASLRKTHQLLKEQTGWRQTISFTSEVLKHGLVYPSKFLLCGQQKGDSGRLKLNFDRRQELVRYVDKRISMLLSFLVVVYNNLCIKSFGSFHCVSRGVGKGSYLYQDPNIMCWEDREHYYLVVLSVISLVIYVIAIPVGIALTISYFRRTNSLFKPEVINRLGFLYRRYESNRHLWEVSFLIRRFVVSVVYVFYGSSAPYIAMMWVMGALGLNLSFSSSFMPFKDRAIDLIDIFSIMCIMFYLLAGVVADVLPENADNLGFLLNCIVWGLILYCIFATLRETRGKRMAKTYARNIRKIMLKVKESFQNAPEGEKASSTDSSLGKKMVMGDVLWTNQNAQGSLCNALKGLKEEGYVSVTLAQICEWLRKNKERYVHPEHPLFYLLRRVIGISDIDSLPVESSIHALEGVMKDVSVLDGIIHANSSTAGELSATLKPELLRALIDGLAKEVDEEEVTHSYTRFITLTIAMQNVLGDNCAVGDYSHYPEAILLKKLTRAIPALVDYALTCTEHEAEALRTTFVGLCRMAMHRGKSGFLAPLCVEEDHGPMLYWLMLADKYDRQLLRVFLEEVELEAVHAEDSKKKFLARRRQAECERANSYDIPASPYTPSSLDLSAVAAAAVGGGGGNTRDYDAEAGNGGGTVNDKRRRRMTKAKSAMSTEMKRTLRQSHPDSKLRARKTTLSGFVGNAIDAGFNMIDPVLTRIDGERMPMTRAAGHEEAQEFKDTGFRIFKSSHAGAKDEIRSHSLRRFEHGLGMMDFDEDDEEKRKDQSGRALGQGMKGGKLDSYPIGL